MASSMLFNQKGLTLIELLSVLAIVAIAASAAAPAMSNQIKNNRLVSTANQLQSVFKFARSEAAKRDLAILMNEDSGQWLVQLQGETLQKFSVSYSDIAVIGLKDITLSRSGEAEANKIKITDGDSDTTDYCFSIFTSGQSELTKSNSCS